MSESVGVVGLGTMGSGIAATLKGAGRDVHGYDPSPAAGRIAQDHGVPCAVEISELACEAYVLSLPSARVVRDVVPELLRTGRARVVVDTTTSDPQTSAEMATLCAESGVHFVDAPVSGGRAGAWSGQLAAFVGGEAAAVDVAAGVLDAFTGRWHHLGPPGAGNVVKLLNNLLCAANIVAVAEAVDVLSAYGLDVRRSVAALNTGSGRSLVSEVVFAESILRGRLEGGFTVGLMTRDVELGLATVRAGGAEPAVLPAVVGSWRGALERLGVSADCNLAPSAFASATDVFEPENLARLASADDEKGDS
ncbi:NAD(P)-dependent oxidoreductase [Nonomuraea indica]|uniref:NAD(P)-dependent oxidoreductase n=1 Tax=Nonomuraea indica TaxID=1581193 RepID=A0ABW8ADU0_9ACTN